MPRLPNDILPAFDAGGIHDRLTSCKTLRDTAIVLYLLDSGCRSAEFVALTVGHGNMQSGAVTVKQGKGSKDRVMLLGSKARKALRRYMGERQDAKPAEALWLSHRASWAMLTCQCYGASWHELCGNGRLDILAGEVGVADPATDEYIVRLPRLMVFANDGRGHFTRHVYDEGTGIHEAVLADMRRRGVLDIVGKPLHGAGKWQVHVYYRQAA